MILFLRSELLCQCTHPAVPRLSPNIPTEAETVRSVGQADEQILCVLRAHTVEHLHEHPIAVYRQCLVRCQLWGKTLCSSMECLVYQI